MLLVVAGSRHYNKETKRRDCLNDVITYNPLDKKWVDLKCDGTILEHRRYHSATIVGKHLLVYGGINSSEVYLSDIMVLTLGRANNRESKINSFKWFKATSKGVKPGKLAFHTALLVLNPERHRAPVPIDLFNIPEVRGYRAKVKVLIY